MRNFCFKSHISATRSILLKCRQVLTIQSSKFSRQNQRFAKNRKIFFFFYRKRFKNPPSRQMTGERVRFKIVANKNKKKMSIGSYQSQQIPISLAVCRFHFASPSILSAFQPLRLRHSIFAFLRKLFIVGRESIKLEQEININFFSFFFSSAHN